MATKKNDIGVTVGVDGEKQLKQSLSEINAALGVNTSQLKLLDAEYGKNNRSVEALSAKSETLEESLLSQGDKVEFLSKKLQESVSKWGEADTRAMKYTTQLNEARAAEISLSQTLEQTNQSLERAKSSADGYDHSLDESGKSAGLFGSSITKVFNNLISDADKGKLSIDGILGSVKDGINDIGKNANESSDVLSSAMSGAPVAAAGTLVLAVAKIALEGKKVANEFEASSVQIQNALNLTKDKADDAAQSVKNVYNQGLADSQETAQEVLTNVMKYFEVEGKEAENFSNKILAIGQDSETTIRTARTLSQQFGISYAESLDVIAAGMSAVKAENSETLGALNEFANSFSRLGYDAQGFLSTLAAGMDAGAYSVDKAADSIKEFYNKASSGDTGFSEALKELNMSSDYTINQLTAGGEQAQKTFERVVTKLANVQNETKQAEIASKLFGTQWEDVGTKAILAMGSTEKELIKYSGTSQKQLENIVTSSENVDKQVSRTMESIGKQTLNYGSYLLGPWRIAYDGIENIVKIFTEKTNASVVQSEETGRALIDGVRVGWESGERALNQSVENSITGALKSAQKAGEIHSPSKLFDRELGMQLAAGTDQGWLKGMKRFEQSVSDTVRNIPGQAVSGIQTVKQPAISSAIGPAEHTTNNTFNISVDNLPAFNAIVQRAQNERMSMRKGLAKF